MQRQLGGVLLRRPQHLWSPGRVETPAATASGAAMASARIPAHSQPGVGANIWGNAAAPLRVGGGGRGWVSAGRARRWPPAVREGADLGGADEAAAVGGGGPPLHAADALGDALELVEALRQEDDAGSGGGGVLCGGRREGVGMGGAEPVQAVALLRHTHATIANDSNETDCGTLTHGAFYMHCATVAKRTCWANLNT